MEQDWSPQRWANNLTVLLNQVYAATSDRFPVNVRSLAPEFSAQRFPNDPITLVQGDDLDGFDGALYRAPPGKLGWGIIYNSAIASVGRINFTLAHEFGHYLLHRIAYPEGLECGAQDMVRWDSEYGRIESQANEFAAALLMPLDDFRRQIDARTQPDLEVIGACAERYGVSLIAGTLRWLEYTSRRSVLVASSDGFILWSRASKRALRTGAYFRTANRAPIEIPVTSLAAQPALLTASRGQRSHGEDIWFAEPCDEITLLSDLYNFTVSLLHLEDREPSWRADGDEDEADVLDVMNRHPLQPR